MSEFIRVLNKVFYHPAEGGCWLAPDNEGYPHAEAEAWAADNPEGGGEQ